MNTAVLILLPVTCVAMWHLLGIFKIIAQSWVRAKKIKKNGIEAVAWIVQVHRTTETVRSIPYVKLLLEVHPPEGSRFITEISSVFSVTQSGQLKEGARLTVRYDPADINAVVLKKNNGRADGKPFIYKQPSQIY